MSHVIGDPRKAGETGPAGDQRKAGEAGKAGDTRDAGQSVSKPAEPKSTTAKAQTKSK